MGIMSKQDLLLIGITIVLATIVIIVINIQMKKTKPALKRTKKEKMNIAIYHVLQKNRFTKSYIAKLTKRLGLLSVYTKEEIQNGVTKYTKRLFYLVVITFVVGCLVFDDIVTVLICLVASYIYISTAIERTIEATTIVVYRQLKLAIASIRIEYKKMNHDVLMFVELNQRINFNNDSYKAVIHRLLSHENFL